jgi:DnaJ-class molecular chaperone
MNLESKIDSPQPLLDSAEPNSKICECAYCEGTGKDRFRIMSPLSTCPVCHGRGSHRLFFPTVRCAYCRGTGVSPIGARNPCLACSGKGFHFQPRLLDESKSRPELCPDCAGTGTKRTNGFYCYPCRGTGLKRLF